MSQWSVALLAKGSDGSLALIAQVKVEASSRSEAECIVLEEYWDSRLDAASCVPRTIVERYRPSTD